MKKIAKDVEMEMIQDGVTFDGLTPKAGEVVKVTAMTADHLRRRGFAKAAAGEPAKKAKTKTAAK